MRSMRPHRPHGGLCAGEIAVQVQRERPGRAEGVLLRQLFLRGPGGALMEGHIETGVPVVAGYRRHHHHPQQARRGVNTSLKLGTTRRSDSTRLA